MYIFTGICLVMFILTFAFYLYSRRKEFLFYTIFVLFLFLYLSADILQLHSFFFGESYYTSYAFFQIAQVVINLFYILFVMFYFQDYAEPSSIHPDTLQPNSAYHAEQSKDRLCGSVSLRRYVSEALTEYFRH